MAIKIQWLSHATFRITSADTVIYIDPWKLQNPTADADYIFISHSHFDHYSPDDINALTSDKTTIYASADVIDAEQRGEKLTPGATITRPAINIEAVPAYNPNKDFHPRANNWLGLILELDGKRIYYAGDTDVTEEMKALQNIEVALLPVGGTYTMNPAEAAEAANTFKPKLAIPYHWGNIVGTRADADNFAQLTKVPTKILPPRDATTIE